jgi:AcrR family transcriptional regulator
MSRPADPTARISLLTAAEAVFAEKGVAAAKVEEIAKRANVSKGAFYLHFDTKEDALRAVVEAFLARCTAIVVTPCDPADLPETPDELLDFCMERDVEVLEFFWQNRAILAILGNCQGPHAYLVEAFREDVAKRTEAWIDTLKGRAMFRPELDSELVSTFLCGAYHELVHKLVASPRKPPIRDWVRTIQSAFIRGLGTEEFAAASARSDAADPPKHAERAVRNSPVTHAVSSSRHS